MPWLSPSAIPHIANFLKQHTISNALEFGSGRSTHWLLGYCNSLISIETNAWWASKVRNQVNESVHSSKLKLLNSSDATPSEYLSPLQDFSLSYQFI